MSGRLKGALKGTLWMLAHCIAAALCAVFVMHPSIDLAFLTGGALIPAAILGVVYWRSPKHLITVPVVLAPLLFLATAVGVGFFLGQREKLSRAAMKNEVSAALANQHGNFGAPSTAATGDSATLSLVMQGAVKRLSDLNARYVASLTKAGCVDALNPVNVARDGNFNAVAQVIEICRALVQKFEIEDDQNIDQYGADLRTMRVSESVRDDALDSYNSNLEDNKRLHRQAWSTELAIVSASSSIVEYLAEHKKGWIYLREKGQILFLNEGDLSAFNALTEVKAKAVAAARKYQDEANKRQLKIQSEINKL